MRRCLPIMTLLAFAAPALAQEEEAEPVIDTGQMDRLAATVTPQPWYPEGYFDIRVVAEMQVAEIPRDRRATVGPCPDGKGTCYDLLDPLGPRVARGESDKVILRYGDVALDTSRIRQEMERIGYSAAIYAQPLAAYEKRLIEAATNPASAPANIDYLAADELAQALEAKRRQLAPAMPAIVADTLYLKSLIENRATDRALVVRSAGPSAKAYPAGMKIAATGRLTLRAGDSLTLIGAGEPRTIQGPGTFSASSGAIEYVDGAGAVARIPTTFLSGRLLAGNRVTRGGATRGTLPEGVTVTTSPPNGEVLLASVFAFKLCARKKIDMWNRFACKWTEIETGVATRLSGRYVYQVKWPDGTVRKGTRDVSPGPTGSSTVILRKVGS